jgi:tRNA nucleotidyltransferase/poly(A) polymerase
MTIDAERDFAVQIVRRLRDAGFHALFAGGCVRDHLLDVRPKDYDVATDATPDQIRDVFGQRRTLAIGQAFGVITVLGPRDVGQIEVATFRRDAQYSDGRRPDSVEFCDAEEDARRRDFTINGLFYDPLEERVIDYVGGQRDLQLRLIRAIGDPDQRIAEDKLRMLRAVRIAATYDFAVDPETFAAVCRNAAEISVVSAERIAAELRRMLSQSRRRRAADLLQRSGLLEVILPELAVVERDGTSARWQTTLEILDAVKSDEFAVAFAVLLRTGIVAGGQDLAVIREIGERLRLTTREQRDLSFFLRNEASVLQARSLPWPSLQRILIQEPAGGLLSYAEAISSVLGEHRADVEFCREKLQLPPAALNPPVLITGNDLKRLGIPAGPAYRPILDAVRDAQLDQRIRSRDGALELARQLAGEHPPASIRPQNGAR